MLGEYVNKLNTFVKRWLCFISVKEVLVFHHQLRVPWKQKSNHSAYQILSSISYTCTVSFGILVTA